MPAGTILKIHPIKESRNGNSYKRVEFTMEDGSWAKTDLVPKFRNYKNWKGIKEGDFITGLKFHAPKEIDADSKIRIEVIKNG